MEHTCKALFLDLDGTLLNNAKEITPGNRAAIVRALAAGHRIVITTGRPLVSAIDQAQRLALDGPGCYLIAYNGGVIYDCGAGQVIFQKKVPLRLVYPVFQEANKRNIHIQTYNDNRVLVEPRCYNEVVARYCRLIRMRFGVLPEIHQLAQEPAKMLVIDYQHREPLFAFQDWLLSRFGAELDAFFSCDQYLEIVPRGLSKGNALLQLADLLGIPREQTVAVGDAANDLSMLQAAQVGVAMANGTAEAKALANDVTTRDNNHDGVAEVIEKHLFHRSEICL